MAVPTIEEQTDRRSPRRLVRLGAWLVAGSAVAAGRLWEYGAATALPLPLGLVGVGIACVTAGARGLLRAARVEQQLARALDCEAELRRLLADVERDETETTRALVERGFRNPQVRRWILRRFAAGGGSQAPAVEIRQAMKPL